MTLQTQALGLSARQFRAFDRTGLTAEFAVPEHWEVTTMAAYGKPASRYSTPKRARRSRCSTTIVPTAGSPSSANNLVR